MNLDDCNGCGGGPCHGDCDIVESKVNYHYVWVVPPGDSPDRFADAYKKRCYCSIGKTHQ